MRYQIIQTNMMRIIQQTVRRITIKILGIKGLKRESTQTDQSLENKGDEVVIGFFGFEFDWLHRDGITDHNAQE